MKKPIVTDIVFLRTKSREINFNEEKKLYQETIKDLEDSLDLTKGVGLSAIQIGVPLRIGIVRLPTCKLNLYNPEIITRSHKFRFVGEHCLSLPGYSVDTKRYGTIRLRNGDGKEYILSEFEAVVVQHEVSHMNAKLMFDDKWRKRR